MKPQSIVLIFAVWFITTFNCHADSPVEPKGWMTRLDACLEGVFSYQADFEQELVHPLDVKTPKSKGTVKIRKGGRVRIQYKDGRLLVCDGKTVWTWDPSSKTAIREKVSANLLPKIFDLFINGTYDRFTPEEIGQEESQFVVVKLVPKKTDPLVKSVVLTLERDCPSIRRIMVLDHAGIITRVTFKKIRKNVGLGSNLFKFTPPSGAKIIQP